MRKPVFVVGLFALTLAVAPACATKKFVRTEVGQVNDKVGTLGKSLEETQERVRTAEGRITEVDTQGRAGRRQGRAGAAERRPGTAGGQRGRRSASLSWTRAPAPSKRPAASCSSKSC